LADVTEAAMARLRDHHGDPLEHVTVDVGAATVHGDAAALHEILFQLLDNAVRYGHEEPIAVRARSGDEAVLIEVVDRGPGLADDDAEALFGPFRRGMAARGNWGTGLGLPLTARLVAAMDGRIWASNGVTGGGSVFSVELPAGRYRDADQSD
jgi:two-component system sensor histidine kinase KdpD